MELDFVINAPPFSLNKAYYKNRQRTQECRKWGDKILSQLEAHSCDFNNLHDHVMSQINNIELSVSLTFYLPKSKLYTKKGKVSRLSNDLSNIEKLLIDLIFDSRFHDRGHPNLNLDDCLITELISRKQVSETDDYFIRVVIKPLSYS
jgi:Holliday junction resolvase RusA-like endonuclease